MITVREAPKASSQPGWARSSPVGRKSNSVSTIFPQRPGAIPVNANERLGDGSFALPAQRKLAVGSARDPHELEADAMAAQVSGGGMAGQTRTRAPADGMEQT